MGLSGFGYQAMSINQSDNDKISYIGGGLEETKWTRGFTLYNSSSVHLLPDDGVQHANNRASIDAKNNLLSNLSTSGQNSIVDLNKSCFLSTAVLSEEKIHNISSI